MIWILVLAIAAEALAQGTAAPATIEGSVVNSITGRAISGAKVEARAAGFGTQTASDNEGHWTLTLKSGGVVYVTAEHPSFASGQFGRRMVSKPVRIVAGENRKGMVLSLAPLSSVSGRVTDADGDPVRMCPVQLFASMTNRNGRSLFAAASANTNDLGEYRIFQVVPGEYLLASRCHLPSLEARPLAPLRKDTAASDPPPSMLFYPGVANLASSTKLQIAAGSELGGMDFRVRPLSLVLVQGHGLLPPEGAGQPAHLAIFPQDAQLRTLGPLLVTSLDPKDGHWSANLPAGDYELVATGGTDDRRFHGRRSITVGDTAPDSFDIPLANAAEITGHVRIEDSAEAPESSSKTGITQISLMPVQPSTMMAGGGNGQVNANGEFSLHGVTPGEYEIVLMAPGVYLKSASLNGQSFPPQHVSITSSGSLELVASGKTAQVSGTVDGNDEAGIVLLVPQGAAASSQALGRVAPIFNRSFRLQDVAPGTYKLIALNGENVDMSADPRVSDAVEKSGEVLSVSEGERVTRQLKAVSLNQ